jgi:hypothetical protein
VIASFASPGTPGRRSRPSRSQCGGRFSRASSTCSKNRFRHSLTPFSEDDPLPKAYELHLPFAGVTIWYVVAPYRGQEIISIQPVRLDT